MLEKIAVRRFKISKVVFDTLVYHSAFHANLSDKLSKKCFIKWGKFQRTVYCKSSTISSASCTLERSFSNARRLKTWLRAMKSRRFYSLTILNIHKDVTDKLDFKAIGNEFVSRIE